MKFLPELRRHTKMVNEWSLGELKTIRVKSEETGMRLKIIEKLKSDPNLNIYLSNQQLRFESSDNLLRLFHQTRLTFIQHLAATKIRQTWKRYIVQKAFQIFIRAAIKIARWYRKRVELRRMKNMSKMRKAQCAVIIQAFMRGYFVHKHTRADMDK